MILSGFISIVASSYDVAASILLSTLLLELVFSRRSSKDMVNEDILFTWSSIFDKKIGRSLFENLGIIPEAVCL